MEKGKSSGLFVNDGSFMERFNQLQQESGKDKAKIGESLEDSKPTKVISMASSSRSTVSKTTVEFKVNNTRKTTPIATGGKLAFSLKSKSKIVVPPVKLGSDEEDEDEKDPNSFPIDAPIKRQKLGHQDASEQSSSQTDVAPLPPSDPTVKKVADKLASFVAKNGRQFENITRQKNPGDTPFKFLFDESCADYKYYEHRLAEEEKALSQAMDPHTPHSGSASASSSKPKSGSQRLVQQQSSYQIPASALYESSEEYRISLGPVQTSAGKNSSGDSGAPAGSDPIAMMEFYMKKAAKEERMKQPKHSKDEMPPPASLLGPGKRGHHMGDYIPQDELENFLSKCNDAAAQKAAKESAEKAKIQADNVGHKLLSKMGWKEGEGLGSSKKGIADPITAGSVKKNHLGVGAQEPGEVTAEDDIYEQYKKRMMLGYKYRPNPLNNPRKAYY